jgi:hypothetical protein
MPSLNERIESAQHTARPANVGGCVTCRWWSQISNHTQQLINQWLDSGHSQRQLWDILTAPSEGSDDPVLEISITGFRLHLNHHDVKCRSEQPAE